MNNLSIEAKKEVNKIITRCAIMIIRPIKGVNAGHTLEKVADSNYDYVAEYMTLEQFKMYLQIKINIIQSDIF